MKRLLCMLGLHKWTDWQDVEIATLFTVLAGEEYQRRCCQWCNYAQKRRVAYK